MRESLREALAQLTKEEYELIQALYYENISEREYAAKLGLSQRGLNKRRHRALAKLKKSFGMSHFLVLNPLLKLDK